MKEQHIGLVSKLVGHFNYFGVNGNIKSLAILRMQMEGAWYKWLHRRSQKASLTWERFTDLLRQFPLPVPRIVVTIWGG